MMKSILWPHSRYIFLILLALSLQACSSGSSGVVTDPGAPPPVAPTWTTPIRLFDSHGRLSAGDQLYALGQDRGATDFVATRSADQGASWSGAISTIAGANNQNIYRGFQAEGQVLHLIARDASNNQLYYHRSNDGGATWQNRVQISTAPGDAQSFRRYSLASSNGILHLMDFDPSTATLGLRYFRSADAGQTWVRERITPGVGFGVVSWELPTLWVNGDTIHLTWSGEDGAAENQIYYARSDDGGVSFASIFRLSDGTKLSWRQDIAVVDGTVVVGWGERELDVTDEDDFVVRRSLDGGATWEPRQIIVAAPQGRRYAVHVTMAAGPGDRIHATYIDDDVNSPKANLRALYQLSEDRGATWGPIEEVATNAADDVSQVFSIAVSADFVHVLLGGSGSGDGPQPTMYARRPLQ